MVRWLRWHCPPDTGFEIRVLAVWGRARYLSVTEAPHNTNFHTWMGKKQFRFFQTAETGNRTPVSGVKGSGANHYPRAPAPVGCKELDQQILVLSFSWYVTSTQNHCPLNSQHSRQMLAQFRRNVCAVGSVGWTSIFRWRLHVIWRHTNLQSIN